MRRRRDEIAELVDAVRIADADTFAGTLQALVVAAGELPEAQWWRRWATSASSAERLRRGQL